MDRLELVRGFIHENLRLLTESPFRSFEYREKKRQYFLVKHANSKQGYPRDSEIASETVWFLIRKGQIQTKEQLDKALSSGLMAEKCPSREIFYESLPTSRPQEPVVDYKRLRQGEFLESVRDQIRDELKKEMEIQGAFDEQIVRQRLAEYAALPSVVDAEEYEEPAKPPEEFDSEENLEWWERLHLIGDPFQQTEGLVNVKPERYDSVVVKTQLFQRYIRYMEMIPDELFKNTILFGEYGSGKTTLFQYVRRALETHGVDSVYVHLFGEKDFQSLKIAFKEKLVGELRSLLSESEPPLPQVEFGDIDANLYGLMKQLRQKPKFKGLLVFVDDLNKKKEDFGLALEFLNYLQVFTYELAEKASLSSLGFYVAGALEWEPIVRTQPKYSGSLARREIIPDITEEQAWIMLNKRLEAYYPNPEVKREVDRNFVMQVYRNLKANNDELTFRKFIQRLQMEFKANNFRVLVSDPVHIPQETLQKIKSTLDGDPILKERFRALMEDKIQVNPENRIVCVRLLLDIFLREKTRRFRDEDLEVDRRFYLKQLAMTGLISKVREGKDDHSWAACTELHDINKEISAEFSLSLEDYLLKIYGISPGRRRRTNEEMEQLKLFSEKCDQESKGVIDKISLLHADISEALENYSLKSSESDLLRKCSESLNLLTQFYVSRIEKAEDSEGGPVDFMFWKDFWFFPDEIAAFQNARLDEDDCIRKIWKVLGIYRDAFNVLFSFIKKEHAGLSSVHISSFGLDNDDIKQLVNARDLWTDDNYDRCTVVLYNHIQGKMRTFVQNALTLIYGELPNRVKHVNQKTRQKIQSASASRPPRAGVQFKESSFLSFEDLVTLVTDDRGIGDSSCWRSIFSKLLQPATMEDITRYCDRLQAMRERYGEETESTSDESLDLRETILTTVELTRRMNATYSLLLKSLCMERGSAGTTSMFFSLDGLSKSELIGLPFQKSATESLIAGMSSGWVRMDDQAFIQEYYSMPYREFCINLALTLDESKAAEVGVTVKYFLDETKGSAIHVKRIFRFSKENPPRISLAHSGKDETFVRDLASDLRDNKVKVWIDDFELKDGNPIFPANHEPLKERDHLGIVLSQNSVKSEWIKKDFSADLVKELEKKQIRIHPLLYRDCDVPPPIADKRLVDFRANYQRGLEDLLTRVDELGPRPTTEYNKRVDAVGQRIANLLNATLCQSISPNWMSELPDKAVVSKASDRLLRKVPEDPRTEKHQFFTLGELKDILRVERVWTIMRPAFVNVKGSSSAFKFNTDELFFGSLDLLIAYRNPLSHGTEIEVAKQNLDMIEASLFKLEKILVV